KDDDLLCAPSRYDGWGLVILEGLAAGMPVISTDGAGAARELIQQNINGWRIPADDCFALEQALREAARMEDVAFQRMSDAAIESVQGYTLEKGAARFIAAARGTLDWFSSGCAATPAGARIARAE
ncbi:MAG: glycosyltransferase, partial [Thermoanaerobaculia bacterium]